MDERTPEQFPRSVERAGGDPIASLLRAAGRRATAPDDVEARVRTATHDEWRRIVRARRRRTWSWRVGSVAAAAAAVVMTLALRDVETRGPTTAERVVAKDGIVVATVERLSGEPLRIERADGVVVRGVGRNAPVLRGSQVATGASGGVALRLSNGSSLRLGERTVVRLTSPTELGLEAGVLYVDGGEEGSSDVEVHTGLGVIREEGTQFEVRLLNDTVRIRVREGSVLLDREEGLVRAPAGVELRVAMDGTLEEEALTAYGDHWSWVQDLAPGFEIEGARLAEFLEWTRRETGLRIDAAFPEVEERIAETVLHGSVEGLRPDEALEAVLPTCGLSAVRRGGSVELR